MISVYVYVFMYLVYIYMDNIPHKLLRPSQFREKFMEILE